MIFPTTDGGTWELDDRQIEQWQLSFRNVNVREEMEHARAWCEANPPKRKTANGMPRFCVNWLTKQANYAKFNSRSVSRGGDVKRDGAYQEIPGSRPPSNQVYSDAYWKARGEGFSNMASARIATAAMERSEAERDAAANVKTPGPVKRRSGVGVDPKVPGKHPGRPETDRSMRDDVPDASFPE